MTADEKKEIKQAVLDEIKAESNDITEVETVSSLDGLTGLPAMQGEKLVTAPLSLLSKPATDAAAVANAAAETANTAADTANKAAEKADTATANAKYAASTANTAANAANAAAENINSHNNRIKLAMKGASARFDGFVYDVTISFLSSTTISGVYYDMVNKVFCAKMSESDKYVNNWTVDSNVYSADMFMDETRSNPLKDKVYMCGASLYVWSDEEDNLVEVSGGGSGSGFYNVTNEQPLSSGYYDKDTAIAALENANIKDKNKMGMILTFEKSAGVWVDYRFTASDVGKFLTPASWEEYGGGNIKTGSPHVVAGIVNADVIAEKGIGESHTLQSAISTIPESLRRTGVCVRFADAGIESYSLEIYSKPIADGWKWEIELDGKNAEITLNQSMTIKDVADAAMAVAGTFSDWTFTREAEGKIRIDRKFEGRCIPPFISNGCGFRLRYISVGTSREERTFQYTGKDSSSIGDTALWRDVSKSPINWNDLTRLFSFNLRYGHV